MYNFFDWYAAACLHTTTTPPLSTACISSARHSLHTCDSLSFLQPPPPQTWNESIFLGAYYLNVSNVHNLTRISLCAIFHTMRQECGEWEEIFRFPSTDVKRRASFPRSPTLNLTQCCRSCVCVVWHWRRRRVVYICVWVCVCVYV